MPEEVVPAPESKLDYDAFSHWRNTGELPKEEVEQPAVEETKTVEESEPSKQEQEEAERDDKGRFKPKESEVPPGVQKRIDKAIAKQRDAERRAEEAERKLNEVQVKKPAESVQTSDPEPKEEEFQDYREFIKAQARWEVRQEIQKAQKQRDEEQVKKQVEDERKSVLTAWQKSQEEAKAKYDDYQESLDAVSDVILPDHVSFAILHSDSQAEVAYYLAKNRAELERIVKVPSHRIGYEIGKLEAKLAKPPAPEPKPKVTSAPKPPEPVGARATASSNPVDATDYVDYEKRRNAQLYRK